MRRGTGLGCWLLLCLCLNAGAQEVQPRPLSAPKPLLPEQDTVSMMIIGDVMMHSRQLQYDYR